MAGHLPDCLNAAARTMAAALIEENHRRVEAEAKLVALVDALKLNLDYHNTITSIICEPSDEFQAEISRKRRAAYKATKAALAGKKEGDDAAHDL